MITSVSRLPVKGVKAKDVINETSFQHSEKNPREEIASTLLAPDSYVSAICEYFFNLDNDI